jgi:hypothetical protein
MGQFLVFERSAGDRKVVKTSGYPQGYKITAGVEADSL